MTARAGAREIEESLNAAAFATNAGVIDLLAFVLVWGRAGAACSSSRRDDCFQDFGIHVLEALGEDGSKIKLEQSESTMRDSARTAAAHRIVPIG
jgi:hypothetical protein